MSSSIYRNDVVQAQNARYLGVVPGDPTKAESNTAAAQAILDANLGPLYFPTGVYYFSDKLTITADYHTIFGDGEGHSILRFPNTKNGIETQKKFITLRDFSITGTDAANLMGTAIKIGVDGDTYTSHNIIMIGLRVSYAALGLYNGKSDGSAIYSSCFSYNTKHVITDGNQDDFLLSKCCMNDSTDTALTATGGGRALLVAPLFANTAISAGYAIYCVNFGSVVCVGGHFEAVRNYVEDSIYIYIDTNSGGTFYNCFFQNGGNSLRAILAGAGAQLSVFGGIATTTATDGAHIWVNKFCRGIGDWIVSYNGVRNYKVGDFNAQTADNPLPTPTEELTGQVYVQMRYGSLPTTADEGYICVKNSSGTPIWSPLNLNTRSLTADPHVNGQMWDNAGVVNISHG